MEKKKSLTSSLHKKNHVKKSHEKIKHKEVLSIYKTPDSFNIFKSFRITDTETQSSITFHNLKINLQKLNKKYFNSILLENQNKNCLTIIDDFIESNFLFHSDYATPQTISLTQAFKYSSKTQNLNKMFTFHALEKSKNLEHNLSLAIKTQKNIENKHLIFHFHQNFYNFFVENLNKHKKTKQKYFLASDSKASTFKELQYDYFQKNLNQQNDYLFQKKYKQILQHSDLSKYSMTEDQVNQNNESQDFAKLVSKLNKLFASKTNEKKLRQRKCGKINQIFKLEKNKLFKSPKNVLSPCRTSRNSMAKNCEKKVLKNSHKNTYYFTQESSPIKSKQYGNKFGIENAYFLPFNSSKISKTSTVTPKQFSQYPSVINIQQKPISMIRSAQKWKKTTKDSISKSIKSKLLKNTEKNVTENVKKELKGETKKLKKCFSGSQKENINKDSNQYGIQSNRNKTKLLQKKLMQNQQNKIMKNSVQKKNSKQKSNQRSSLKERDKIKQKKIISGYATCDVSMSKRISVFDDYLCS